MHVFEFGFSLISLMQLGALLIMCSIINAIIGAGLLAFKKSLPGEHLLKTAAALLGTGLVCLAIVAAIGGVGIFNA